MMKLTDEDEALIAAAVNGSALAWEKLVRRYEGRIFNQGLRLMGNNSDAMDLVQEVFLGVYRNLHRFRGDSKFSSWIFRIAYNKAVDMNRYNNIMASRTHRNGEAELDILENIPGRSNLEGEKILSDYQVNKKIVSMLAALPLKQRLIVELKMFQSLTFEEIADIYEISVNTAKTRFYSAIKKLKDVSESEHVL